MATALGLLAFLLIIAGFVVALVIVAAPSPPTWLSVALAATMGFEALWLVLLARQRDTYFDPDHVTRWEFAGQSGNQWFVVVAIIAAGAAGAGLLIGIRRVAAGAAAISLVVVLMASFVLTVGH